MKFNKRKFAKILGFLTLGLIFPLNTIFAATKKIINPNLSNEQKKSCLMTVQKDHFQAIY